MVPYIIVQFWINQISQLKDLLGEQYQYEYQIYSNQIYTIRSFCIMFKVRNFELTF